jgi:3-oxoacyl-[acyl-carrier protein] reductase
MNRIDLEGRSAIVTGGAQGFGRAIAQRFVASGARVAIWDHDYDLAQRAVVELGSNVIALKADVSNVEDVQRVTSTTLEALGRIDILVNNAGVAGSVTPLWETETAEWRRVLRINLEGTFVCCKAVIPSMVSQNYGRIINVASVAGKEGNPNSAHYSASKAGVIGLTKSLGKELARYDISVNAVTPTAAQTAILDAMPQQRIDYILSKIPRGRFLKVEEMAAMVAWMASEECTYTTGAIFDLSGGRATY